MNCVLRMLSSPHLCKCPAHNPFGADQNQVVFVTPDTVREFPLLSKDEVARLLIDEIVHLLCARERRPGPGARLP